MPLWGANNDPAVASANKPKWLLAGTARKYKKNQNSANTYGVSVAEVANTHKGVTPGWVTAQRGTGPVVSVNVTQLSVGGYTVNTNVSVSFASNAGGQGANGIAQFVGGNLVSIIVDQGGANYTNTPAVSLAGGNGNSGAFVLGAVMGGRVGRTAFETLVTMNTITGDDSANDDIIFGA